MKYLIWFFLVFLIFTFNARGQQAEVNLAIKKHLGYFSFELVFGDFFGMGVGANYIYNEKYTLRVNASHHVNNFLFSNDKGLSNISILPGIFIFKEKLIRMNVMGGIGFSKIFYYKDDYSLNRISAVFNPRLELPLFKYFGLSLSGFYILNNKLNISGVSFGNMIGVLR